MTMRRSADTGSFKPRIAIVSFPVGSHIAADALTNSLVDILAPLCECILLISGTPSGSLKREGAIRRINLDVRLHQRGEIIPIWWSNIIQAAKILAIQVKIGHQLAKNAPEFDGVIFYIGGPSILLPLLAAKTLHKKTAVSAIGLTSLAYMKSGRNRLLAKTLWLVESLTFLLADRVIVESPKVVENLHLGRFLDKVTTKGARCVDTRIFGITKEYGKRDCNVGYIGRLDEAKGVFALVQSIPKILVELEEERSLSFLIGGSGPLEEHIRRYVDNTGMTYRVKLLGWIDHEDVARLLNELRLLVLPSYSEGLPTILLESMSCGTPVLATPVGGVPDIVKDSSTGFLMKDNEPDTIAHNVCRALKFEDIEGLISNANEIIRESFTPEKASLRWNEILEDIFNGKTNI